MKGLLVGRWRPLITGAFFLAVGLTCSEPVSPKGLAAISLAPAFTQSAIDAYSNVVQAGLAIDNIHIVLEHPDGSIAKDTVITYNGTDSIVVIELTVELKETVAKLNAEIEFRDGTLVLFSGSQDIIVKVGGVPNESPIVEVEFVGPGAEVTSIDIAPADSAITVLDSVVFTSTAKDQNNQNVVDYALIWEVKDPARGTVSQTGVFKPSPGRGQTWVIAKTFENVRDSALVRITPLASKIVVISGNDQTGTVGSELPQPVVVESQADDNLPVPGVTVTLIGPPGTIVIQTVSKTDVNGRINLFVPVGTIAGPIAFSATSPGLTTLNLSGTANAGKATKMVITQQPSATASSGATLATQPALRIQDQYDNNVSVAGVGITAALTSAGGRSLSGILNASTNASGVATFTNITINGPVGSTSLTFSQDSMPSVTSSSITLGAGVAAKVMVSTRPSSSVTSGQALALQPIARIADAAGNTVTTSAATVTVSGSAGYTMVGTATVAASSGIVTFNDLGVAGVAGNALLTFASTGLTSDTATVTVTPAIGPPASLAAVSPIAFVDTIQANVNTANLAAVVVKDAQNNVVADAPVTFRLYGGQGSLIDGVNGTSTIPTGPDGIAKLSSQKLRDSIAVDSIEITTPGVADTVWILVGVLNGAPHHLAVLGQPNDADAGQPIAVTVVLQDRLNNIASVFSGAPPDVTLVIRSGFGTTGAVLSPAPSALTQPATSGVASFLVSIDLPGTDYALTASAPGFTSVHTADFQVFEPAPDVVTWVNPSGGNWSVASNWSTGVVPASTDVVKIDLDGTYTVTMDVNVSVRALCIGGTASGTQTVVALGKTITIADESFVYPTGVLSLANSTVTGAGGSYYNEGLILAHGASAINVVFENAGTLRVQGEGSVGHANLTFANGFTNSADLELTSADGGYSSTLTVASGTLVNVGTLSALVGAGGSRTIAAQIDNQGTMTSVQNLNVSKADADHLNSGSIAVTGGDFTFSQTGSTPTFTNAGNIAITASRSFTVAGGEANFGAGTVTGPVNSYVLISDATLTFSTSTILVPVQLSGTSPIAGGAVTVASGQTLRLYGGTLSATLDVQAGGTLEWISNGSITGALTNDGTIKVRGQAFGSNASLTVANGFTNNGTIELTSQDGGYNSTLTVTNGTLVNSATGTIKTSVGASGARTLNAQLDNAGLLDVEQLLTMAKASAVHSNSGTIDLTAANLNLSQSGTTPSFTNTGSVTLGAGRAFNLTGGAVALSGGTVSGTATSTLVVNSSTLDFTIASVSVPLTLLGTTIVGGAVTIAGGELLTLLSGALTDPVTIQDGGTLRTLGSVSLATIVSDVNSMIQPRGQANGGHATLTVANGFTNNGTIELISADGGYNSTLNVTSGTLTNAAGGFIRSMIGAGGARTLGAQLDNQGSLDVVQALALTKASATHLNSGDIYQTSAVLTVTQSGTSPSFTNTGNITMGANRDFTFTGGLVDMSAGTLTGTATSRLVVTGATLAFNTTSVTIPLTLTTTSIVGGSVTIPTGETLILVNGGLSNPVTIAAGGTLLTHGAVSLTGALTTTATGTLRVRGQAFGGHATLTVDNGFTNNGLIDLTSQDGGYGATLVVTNGTLVNAAGATIHSIVAAGGTRTIAAQLDNQGTLDVDQDLTINKLDADHVNNGAIDLTVADLTLTQSGASPSFANTGTVTLANNRTWTVNAGELNLSAGTVSGTALSRLIVSTATIAFSTATVTIPLTLTSTAIQGGSFTIPTGQTLTLLNGGVAEPISITTGGTLLTHGAVSLGGALTLPAGGTLRVRGQANGGHATLTVADGFINSGLIELTSADGGYASTLNVTTGTLTIASGAKIHSLPGEGGTRSLGLQLDNQGTLEIDQDLTLSKTEADHVNGGTIDATAADFTLSQSGSTPTFSQSAAGIIALAAGRSATVNGGNLDVSNGSVTGTATSRLIVNTATMSFTPNTVGVPMTLTSVTTGAITLGTSQTITLLNGGLSDPVTINSGGTLLTHGNVSLAGAMTLNAGGNLRVRGQGQGGHATLTIADGFTSSGLIELTSADGGYSSTLAVTNGQLTNNSGGIIHSDVGAGGARVIAADLRNYGTLDVDQALALHKADADHYNYNAIDLTNADLTVTQTGTTPSFGNGIAGVITLGANRDVTVTGGTANFIGGSLVQGQTSSRLVVTGGTLNFTPAHVTVPLTLTTTSIQGGTVTIASGQTVTLMGGTLSAAVTVESGGVLLAHGIAAASSVAVDAGGVLEVRGQAAGGHTTLTVDNGVTNSGDILLTSADGGYGSTLAVTTGSLTNTGAGTITSAVGAGGTRTIAAQLDNQGSLEVGQALTLSKASAQHSNTGYIDLTTANLTVTQTGTTPTFTNNGTIQLASSRTLTVGGGVLTNAGGDPSGTIQGPGTLNVSTAAFTNHGGLYPNGTLNITGSFTQDVTNGGTNIEMSNTGCTTYGQVAASGVVTLAGALNVSFNDCLPVLGQEFTVLTFASSVGSFTSTNLPDLTAFSLQWQVEYLATSVKLKLVAFP